MWWSIALSSLLAVTCVVSAFLARKAAVSKLRSRITELESELADLELQVSKIQEAWRRLRSAEGMAEMRAERASARAPDGARRQPARRLANPAYGPKGTARAELGFDVNPMRAAIEQSQGK